MSLDFIPYFVGPNPPPRPCSANVFHNVTSLSLRGAKEFCQEKAMGFSEINIKCQSLESMQFIQYCGGKEKSG